MLSDTFLLMLRRDGAMKLVNVHVRGTGPVMINPAHIEAIRFDRLGENSSAAYKINMASGKVHGVSRGCGLRILAAMEGAN